MKIDWDYIIGILSGIGMSIFLVGIALLVVYLIKIS